MRIILSDFMSLDGVVQAPGGREEDTDGGFAARRLVDAVLRPGGHGPGDRRGHAKAPRRCCSAGAPGR